LKLNTYARLRRVVFNPRPDVPTAGREPVKTVAIVVLVVLFVAHTGFTAYLAAQQQQLRAELAAAAERQDAQQKQAIADALVKFKGELGEALKPLVAEVSDTQALAAMSAGVIVGCNGSKFEEGTIGAAAYRAYVHSGACAAQPAKNRRRDE
jgi:hypothetical protein